MSGGDDAKEHSEQETSPTGYQITVPAFYKPSGDDQNDDDDDDDNSLRYPSPLHHIYVQSILSTKEAGKALALAEEYARDTGRWEKPDFERHSTYATCDFAVEDCESLGGYLEDIGFHDRVWKALNERFGVEHEDMTYLDFFCAHYRAANNNNDGDDDDGSDNNVVSSGMDHLEEHRDGSVLSFSVTLSPPDEFEGGGTSFAALVSDSNPAGVVKVSKAGDTVLHSGKLLHGGHLVTSGRRTVLIGFVDVADWCVREGTLGRASRDFGRLDVANFHAKQLQSRLEKMAVTKGSTATEEDESTDGPDMSDEDDESVGNDMFLRESKSVLRLTKSILNPFLSLKARTDPDFQRQRRLETEDRLLRSILLDEKRERSPEEFLGEGEYFAGEDPVTILDGDVTIV